MIGSLFALLLGYIMNAVEDPIVQLFKGRVWKETWFGTLLTALQEKRKEGKEKDIQPFLFPSSRNSEMLPTTLGNIIAAFEDYPIRTYGMDTAQFWPRLYPVLVKNNFFPYIAGQRSPLDFLNFLLNSSLALGIFGFECLAMRVCLYKLPWFIPLAAFALSCLFYRAAIYRAFEWGNTYRTAFDLYRHQLADELRLHTVDSLENEQRMWADVNNLWSYQPNPTFNRFNYPVPDPPIENSDKQKT